jgi:hypothetical protein
MMIARSSLPRASGATRAHTAAGDAARALRRLPARALLRLSSSASFYRSAGISCAARSTGAAEAGGEAGREAAHGAPAASGASAAAELEAERLQALLRRMFSADALQGLFQSLFSADDAAAREAAAALIRLGAGNERLCDAIAAAAATDLPQLLRLLSLVMEAGIRLFGEYGEDQKDDFPLEQRALQRSLLLRCLFSAGDAATREAAAAALVRLGAAKVIHCDAIAAAAAELPQLLTLLLSVADAGCSAEEGGSAGAGAGADSFLREQDALLRSLLQALVKRALNDRAFPEAVAAAEGVIPLLTEKLGSLGTAGSASLVLHALAYDGGERCRAALLSEGCIENLLSALQGDAPDCASYVLGALAATCSDAERDALLAAGVVPLLVEQMGCSYGKKPGGSSASVLRSYAWALRNLATTSVRARGRLPEVRAAGGVAALTDLLLYAMSGCDRNSIYLYVVAEAALLALGEEHRRVGGAAAGPFLSTDVAAALRGMVAGEWFAVEKEGGEESAVFDDNLRARFAAYLLGRWRE